MRKPNHTPVRSRSLFLFIISSLLIPLCSLTEAWGQTSEAPASATEETAPPDSLLVDKLTSLGLTESLSLEHVGCGEMLICTSAGCFPLPAMDTEVSLRVTGPLVSGTIRQRFSNPTGHVIEAVYVFPLPEKAAVNQLEMRIGQRRIISQVREKSEARRVYQQARSTGRKAALTEQQRPNLFTTKVANINPGEVVDVELRFLDRVDYEDGVFSTAFPLTFTPRYYPPSWLAGDMRNEEGRDPERVADARRMSPPVVTEGNPSYPSATLSVVLETGIPLTEVQSTSHRVNTVEEAGSLTVTPTGGRVMADRDFLLRWRPQIGTEPLASLFMEPGKQHSHALLMVVPPADFGDGLPGMPTETIFMLDVSGSMAGTSIEQAKIALDRALQRLRPGDRFNILEFSNTSRIYRSSFQEAQAGNVVDARNWVAMVRANGGTELLPALHRAVSQFAVHTSGDGEPDAVVARRIILLTDAAIGNENQLLTELAGGLGSIRLHIAGIGTAPNRYLVRELARAGGGLGAFVSEVAEAKNGIDAFLERIGRPAVTDLQITWTGMEPEEVFPSRLPDLYVGEPLVMALKLSGSETPTATLHFRLAGGRHEMPLSLRSGAGALHDISTHWARAKIADLMVEQTRGRNQEEIREAIVTTGVAHHLVTPYTSLVAVEELITATGPGHPAHLPAGLPRGSKMLDGSIGRLPATGTRQPLLRLVGWLMIATTGGALWIRRRVVRETRP